MTVFSELRMRPATADRWGWDASTTARLVMAGVVIFTLLVGANLATPLYPLLQATGMSVRFTEVRDGHNWENWRDRLGDGLSWLFPGPQKFVYE